MLVVAYILFTLGMVTSGALSRSTLVAPVCITNTSLPYQLPFTVLPYHYEFNFTVIDPDSLEDLGFLSGKKPILFWGTTSINVTVIQSTSCIILHAHDLSFKTSDVHLQFGESVLTPTSVAFHSDTQFAVLSFSQNLPLGNATLVIHYTGHINTQNATGFFLSDNSYNPVEYQIASDEQLCDRLRSWYTRRSERKRLSMLEAVQPYSSHNAAIHDTSTLTTTFTAGGLKMYATQFEGPYARRAYPCFDEPFYKATFSANFQVINVTFTPPTTAALTVTFNSLLVDTARPTPTTATFAFSTTFHRMSSYLAAFAVGRFDVLQVDTPSLTYRIFTAPGASQYAEFAMNVTQATVAYFSDLWNFSFAERMNIKIDQIAVPAIVQDAMENWAMLTYTPSFLLVDPGVTTLGQRQLVTLVVTHELSHQWFGAYLVPALRSYPPEQIVTLQFLAGDTVTMPWWTQTYLNEGFARYLQYVATDKLFPEWDIWDEGAINSYFAFAFAASLAMDAYGAQPAVIIPLVDVPGTPVSVTAAFGEITYGKGASLNRMFAQYLGEPLWNAGLALQLSTHAYANPDVFDLVDSLSNAAGYEGEEVPNYFLPWLMQSGFPVVTVDIDDNFNVVQLWHDPISRYLEGQLWWIPINFTVTASDGTVYASGVDLVDKMVAVELPALSSGVEWTLLRANANWTAYALVNYADDSQWLPVIAAIADIEATDMLQRQLFVMSTFLLAQMSHSSLWLPLNTTLALSKLLADAHQTTPSEAQALTTQLYVSGTSGGLAGPGWQSLLSPIQYSSYYTYVSELLASSLEGVLERTGWGHPHRKDALSGLRKITTFWSVYFGNAAAMNKSLTILSQYGPEGVWEDIEQAVYWAAGTTGSAKLFAKGQSAIGHVSHTHIVQPNTDYD